MMIFERYETAKLQQSMLCRRLELVRREREQVLPILTERAEVRAFHVMYHVRHWMHRMAPRFARAML